MQWRTDRGSYSVWSLERWVLPVAFERGFMDNCVPRRSQTRLYNRESIARTRQFMKSGLNQNDHAYNLSNYNDHETGFSF